MASVAKAIPQPIPRIAPREDLNPYRIAQIQFDLAAEHLKLDQGLRQILRTPEARAGSIHPHEDGQRPGESVHGIPGAA